MQILVRVHVDRHPSFSRRKKGNARLQGLYRGASMTLLEPGGNLPSFARPVQAWLHFIGTEYDALLLQACAVRFISHRETIYARPRDNPFRGLHQRQRHAVQSNNACGRKQKDGCVCAPLLHTQEQPNNTSLRRLVPLGRTRTKRSAFCQIVRFWGLTDNVAAAPSCTKKNGLPLAAPTWNTCQPGHVPTTVPCAAPPHTVDSYGTLHCHGTA